MIIFSYFTTKPHVVTPQLNLLIKAVQMSGHNIGFIQNEQKLPLIIIKYSLLSRTHGPVVQSIVSLTSSLRSQLLRSQLVKCFATFITKYTDIFC